MSRCGKHPHNRLKAAGLRALPPGRHADGNRLYFLVRLNLARSWVQRVTVEGSRIDLGLGPYPLISLAEARRLAIENLLTIRAGGNPKGDAGRKKGPTATVVDLLEVVIENRSPGWKAKKKTEAVWRHDFKKYVFPAIGGKPIATVTVADVRDIVLPHWRGRNSKGSVLRQNLESLFGCAVAYGYRLDNPAAHVAHILPKFEAPESHQASVPYREVPQVLVEWQNLAVKEPAKLALLFIVLTAGRLTEVTGAKWGEFDLANHRWQVPANRMKGRKAHTVPLSLQATEVLRRAQALRRDDVSLVFPVVDRNGKVAGPSQYVLSYWLRKLGRKDTRDRRVVVHGFRASFRVWSIEVARARKEVAEPALAHRESDATVRAYTADANPIDERTLLMQQWADFILPMSGGIGEG